MKTMKTMARQVIREEGGAALALTVVLLLVAGLIVTPVIAQLGTGIRAGQVHEMKMDEVYSADAGVEEALWLMTELDVPSLSSCEQMSWAHQPEPFELNDRKVRVTMEFVRREGGSDGIFRVKSEVFHLDDTEFNHPLTRIVSYVKAVEVVQDPDEPEPPQEPEPPPPPPDFSGLLDYAISSDGSITIQPNSQVHGDIYIKDPNNLDNKGSHDGDVKDASQVVVTWPTAQQMMDYYFKDVEHLEPYPHASIDIKDHKTIGPLYQDANLTIKNTGSSDTLKLDGTIYVAGNLDFAQPGAGGAYTIDLNGHTIFAEGEIYFPPKFVSLTGSGCIIAVGEVWFQPLSNSNEGDFVFVMSTDNQVWFNPAGNFYGALAGEAHVQLQPGNYLEWTDWRGRSLNFPTGEIQPGPDPEDPDEEEEDDEEEQEPVTAWSTWELISYTIDINPDSA